MHVQVNTVLTVWKYQVKACDIWAQNHGINYILRKIENDTKFKPNVGLCIEFTFKFIS